MFICEYSNGGEYLGAPPLNHGKRSNERAVELSYALVVLAMKRNELEGALTQAASSETTALSEIRQPAFFQ